MIASSLKKNIMLLVVLIGNVLAGKEVDRKEKKVDSTVLAQKKVDSTVLAEEKVNSTVLAEKKYDCFFIYEILKLIQEYNEPKKAVESYCCNHKAVKCNDKMEPPIVTALKLKNKKLKRIPDLIWNLEGLEKLDLRGNFLTDIPKQLCNLKSLRYLYLSGNQLKDLSCSLTKLTKLDLRGNLFTDIPKELSNLKSLKYLDISKNKLSNIQLLQFESLTNLQELYLQQNVMRGTIPDSFWGMTNLIVLNLKDNRLNGTLSEKIGNLRFLKELNLGGNKFEGPIPDAITTLENLEELDLSSNKFSGDIPSQIGNLTKLKKLFLHQNKLDGNISPGIGYLKDLSNLSLSDNTFSGEIPPELENLKELKNLALINNQFVGRIPEGILRLPKLETLYVDHNKDLSGNIEPKCGLEVYSSETGVVICGCASKKSPPSSYPADNTPESCLASEMHNETSSLVKRSQVFSQSFGSRKYMFTCNLETGTLNPFQDCLNTIVRVCSPTYTNYRSEGIQICKDAVDALSSTMNPLWQAVRKDCGQWQWKDSYKVLSLGSCDKSFAVLLKNAYYIFPDPITGRLQKLTLSKEFAQSVKAGLWDRIK